MSFFSIKISKQKTTEQRNQNAFNHSASHRVAIERIPKMLKKREQLTRTKTHFP